MRARLALAYAGIEVEHREIVLRNKPQSLLLASPKGTVPVLSMAGLVLEQSKDIMFWALEKSDPEGWMEVDQARAQSWLERNDGPFKALLDQYKYPGRNPELDQDEVLHAAIELMLKPMDDALQHSRYLMGNNISWIDAAVFPFIRQFSMVNLDQFEMLPFAHLQQWLREWIDADLFAVVMKKYPAWID